MSLTSQNAAQARSSTSEEVKRLVSIPVETAVILLIDNQELRVLKAVYMINCEAERLGWKLRNWHMQNA